MLDFSIVVAQAQVEEKETFDENFLQLPALKFLFGFL
jgi:hypothetical protein